MISVLSGLNYELIYHLKANEQNLFAGEDGSGKTSLMAKMQGADHNKKGRGLEYLYLNVHDEDRDGEFTRRCFSGTRSN